MASAIVVGTDGSDLAQRAGIAGIAILQPVDHVVVATVIESPDPTFTYGTGHAGPIMTEAQYEELRTAERHRAQSAIDGLVAALPAGNVSGRIAEGRAGPALCGLARELDARALVLGTRGRGGMKRAFLGSVSDHVVRNAPCPVVVVSPDAISDDASRA